MKQVNFDDSNYNHKEELKTFLNSFNDLIDKYNKSFDGRTAALNRIKADITRKKNSINKLENNGVELSRREEELKSLKASTTSDIKDLEEKKKTIDYSDSEVMKMEKDDIELLINSKKNKMTKIDAKMESTRNKIQENKENKKTCDSELVDLEAKKRLEEESLFKTESLLKLTEEIRERLNNNVDNILNNCYNSEIVEEPKKEEPIIEQPIVEEDAAEEVVIEEDDNDEYIDDIELENIDIDEPTSDIEVTEENIAPEEIKEENVELSELDLDAIELPPETLPNNELTDETINYEKMLESTFEAEGINFKVFDEDTRKKLVENADIVLKNIIVLKKHGIPLELAIKQPKIFYNITSQDLDDLLNIITTDDEGNGMGFTINYTYYILNELSEVNVDKLIEVYNNEFMNVNSKSGLIKLLKTANSSLQDFKLNRDTNVETLKSLGIKNVDVIVDNYKEFIDLDNPLFLSILNLFDKNDLVNKINSDAKIISKIMEYWLNN